MENHPLIPMKGRMTDKQFSNASTCLVTGINATSFKLAGIAKDLSDVYEYANLFKDRKQLYSLNRAVWKSRPNVGSLVVKEPPPASNFPYVVGLVNQFGPGECREYNSVSKYFIETSRDMHFVHGLMSDTMEDRRENFKWCLKQLADYVIQNKSIGRVVIPAGIGRRGKMDYEWNTVYLKELRSLAQQLDLNNVTTILLEQEFMGAGAGGTRDGSKV